MSDIVMKESHSQWTLDSNQVVAEPTLNEYYLLVSGCIRINYVNQKGESTFVRLVLPGDYLGVERFTESQLSMEYFTITPCTIQREFAVNSELPADVLKTVLIQSYKRCKDVVAYLRCGSAQERLTHLLMMMVKPDAKTVMAKTELNCLMPSIKDCSPSNTRAGPSNTSPSFPEIFATLPPVAKFPYNICKCPVALIGFSFG